MPRFELETDIAASPAQCFDLARDIDFHTRSFNHTEEQAIAGRTRGMIGLDEDVTWRARHFFVWHLHVAKITAYERPLHFRDEMVRGRFKRFVHDHYFEAAGAGTRMRDVIEFESPWGILGRIADGAVLNRYLQKLIQTRNNALKEELEAAGSDVATTV